MRESTKEEIRERFRYDKIQSQHDVFFDLQPRTAEKFREIIELAHKRDFRTFVEVLDCTVSFRRSINIVKELKNNARIPEKGKVEEYLHECEQLFEEAEQHVKTSKKKR